MEQDMESNKWLWQPRKNGPILIRLRYTDIEGKKKTFTRSLNTNHFPTARKIRDKEFLPVVLDIDHARNMLELIRELYPELEKQLLTGKHGGFKDKQPFVTLKKVYNAWHKALSTKGGNYQASENTIYRYSKIVENFINYTGENTAIDNVKSPDIIKYRDKRLEGDQKSKKTLDLELGAIKRFFSYAMEQFGLDINPAVGITVKRTLSDKNRELRLGKRRPPSHNEADLICTAFPEHSHFSRVDFQDFAIFARYTGMRQAEVAQLRKEDFCLLKKNAYADQVLANPNNFLKSYNGDIPKGYVLCIFVHDEESRQTKTGQERIVPVAEKAMSTVLKRINTKSNTIFPCADTPSKLKTFSRTWLKKVKSIDQGLTYHGFRHYATSEMENNGIGENISRMVTGHSVGKDAHVSYVHISIIAMKEAVDKIY